LASSISSGFPGVRTRIVDNSQYVEALSSNLIGMVCIFSEKGPDNVPRLTTSASDFIRTYGAPNSAKYGQGAYVALQYLKTLSNLYVMRVTHPSATYASRAYSLVSKDEVTKYQQVTETEVDENGKTVENITYKEIVPVTVSEDAYVVSEEDLGKDLNTVLETLPEGSDVIVPEGAFGYSLTMENGTKFVGARAEVKPTSDEARDGGETVISAPINPVGDVELSGLTFSGNAFSSGFDDSTVIVVNNSVFKELSEAGSASFEVVAYNASNPETSFDTSATEDMVIKTVTKRHYELEDKALSPFTEVPNIDQAINDGNADIIFYPYGRGEYYNNIGFKLTKAKKSYPGTFVIDIYVKSDDSQWDNLVESFIVSFDLNATDNSGASLYIKDVLDRYSEYLRCKVSDNVVPEEDVEEELNVVNVDYDNVAMAKTTYLVGGSDGPMYTKSGALDWSAMKSPMMLAYRGTIINPDTGEDVSYITDTEDFEISVVYDAGYDEDVKSEILGLCEARNTCFAILDNGFYLENGNKNAKAAIDKRLTTQNWSNYRAALYEPYTKIYDAYTGKYVWMTPIYHVVDLMVKTARDYDIFWAFAGMRRGAITTSIKDYRYLLQGGYRDQFKDNELNPIVRFTNGGDVLWGNWTTQQTPSALKNIHVVLCLQYIQRTLEKNLKQYVYEFNDEYTYALIKNSVNNFLSELQSQRALESFSVSVTATDYQKRNNQCQVDINLKVTGVIEIINVSLNVQ